MEGLIPHKYPPPIISQRGTERVQLNEALERGGVKLGNAGETGYKRKGKCLK